MEMTMAESKSKSASQKRSGGSSSSRKKGSSGSSGSTKSRSSKRSSASNGKSARDVVLEAASQLQELIGRPIEAVLGMEKDGKEWSVALEVLELERVPNTTDILGRYEITVDADGDLISVRRTRRYPRAEAGED
jgi:hypothetical protein